MSQFRISNHYVSHAYLRGWSEDNANVSARRLLVPRIGYPEWELMRIRGRAAFPHLYTSVQGGTESDAIERWLTTEFDDPGAQALHRVRSGVPAGPEDLLRLARFAAALHVRTPEAYAAHVKRTAETLPGILQGTMARVTRELRRAKREGRPPHSDAPPAPATFPKVHLSLGRKLDKARTELKAELVIGRELWLFAVRHLLTSAVRVLDGHSWCVMRPSPGCHFFTSDRPALFLNYNSMEDFNFGGGWNSRGSEVFMPISPDYALYTKIGYQAPVATSRVFSPDVTLTIQRLIARGASRWIIAKGRPMRAVWFRHRLVDLAQFKTEEQGLHDFHRTQIAAEAEVAADAAKSPIRTDIGKTNAHATP